MGCTQSKIENEEAVSRCKDRKQFMKEAVSARNAFAAANSAYAMALKNTGAALSDYAHGEVQNPQQLALGHGSQSLPASSAAAAAASAASSSQPTLDPLIRPPPPPNLMPFTPIQRATSMPEIKLANSRDHIRETNGVGPTIMEEDDGEDGIESSQEKLITRKRSSGSGRNRGGGDHQAAGAASASVASPERSQTVENSRTMQASPQQNSAWDYFFNPVDYIPATTLEVKEDKEEIEQKIFDERPKIEEEVEEKPAAEPPVPPPPPAEEEQEQKVVAEVGAPPPPPGAGGGGSVGRSLKKGKAGAGAGMGEKRVPKGSVNLLQIFVELDDHFLKASESAHEVSKMLEATRLHYHSNFADNRGHIDHSARVMRVITWNRSFRGIPNVDDAKDDFDSEEHETHATVLDKLLAWEKKLYDEVKAGELMKFEYQRKVAQLNKQKRRGTNSEGLEKIKATVSHLHTRYIVDMQSMDSTVMEIKRLRDEQLYPKLAQLVDVMAAMWGSMYVHHDNQSKFMSALKAVDMSQSPKETTEHHHERTIQLWAVVQEWNLQFGKLVDHQKQYIKALNNWLRLNLIPIESSLKEKVSSPERAENPPIRGLLLAWQDHMEKLQDGIARSAIGNFSAIINTIMHHQEEEMKLKERCEESRKELSRKTRQFEDWYHKYTQRRTPDELETEDGMHKDAVAERRFAVDMVQKHLEEEEEEYQRQCIQVREKSLMSLKTHLPELFKAMSNVAFSFSKMYENLQYISQRQNRHESSS
ncbi:hypothetical protein ACOSP7_020560 [Xanthoceras sorbifolium]|uniref:Nitrate regulatory gene2 protein n=1 Tax=Xanthoceras sorbifolium TaxID=99658 RepID=A0ABQ8HLR0_9ROSI|nr:hypothetical protein JRO89_XS09G0162400 [Xanthoceras sorbifolium]